MMVVNEEQREGWEKKGEGGTRWRFERVGGKKRDEMVAVVVVVVVVVSGWQRKNERDLVNRVLSFRPLLELEESKDLGRTFSSADRWINGWRKITFFLNI